MLRNEEVKYVSQQGVSVVTRQFAVWVLGDRSSNRGVGEYFLYIQMVCSVLSI